MRIAILFIALAFGFSGCKNLVPYSNNLRDQFNLNESQIRKIQFYVSSDIIMQREISSANTKIESGKIKMINGRRVQEIIIPIGTKGVLTDMPRENKMLVSFEIDDNHYLSFGVNPNANNYYTLLASNWNGSVGTVTYAGEKVSNEPREQVFATAGGPPQKFKTCKPSSALPRGVR
jgi:hypothetical protein